MKVPEIFDEVAKHMRADVEKARMALQHPGLKGGSFEEIFRLFLREYFPKSLDISTGILVDSNGNASRQVDVIISDAAKTPVLYKSGDVRVIPVECAYAVIEIKAFLDSGELDKIFENMLSVRRLEKKAYYPPGGVIVNYEKLYGRQWSIWPLNYFVFAFDSIALMNLGNLIHTAHINRSLPEWSRIDTVCVLDKGVIHNALADGTIDALPEPNSRLNVCETDRALLLFYALISHYLNQARLPSFRFANYLGQLSFGLGTPLEGI